MVGVSYSDLITINLKFFGLVGMVSGPNRVSIVINGILEVK